MMPAKVLSLISVTFVYHEVEALTTRCEALSGQQHIEARSHSDMRQRELRVESSTGRRMIFSGRKEASMLICLRWASSGP